MNTGIYSITNATNGKCYIGSAVNFSARWHQHRRGLCNANHRSRVLQSAWDKHGEAEFVFEKVLVCSRENLLMYEQLCIDALRPQYNMLKTAGSALGYKHTPEALAKISAAHRGARRPDGTGERIAAAKRGKPWSADMRLKRVGVKQSAEHIEKRIAPLRGFKHTDEARNNMSRAQRGRKQSAEHIAKRAAAIRGRKATPEERAKMSAARLGKKRPQAVCDKMSASLKGRIFTDEWRAKLSAAHARRRKLRAAQAEAANGS